MSPRHVALALLVLAPLLVVSAAFPHPDGLPPTAILACPHDTGFTEPWPVIVLLHGYGVTKEDFDVLAPALAARGLAAIAIDAPHPLQGGGRSWPADNDVVHARVQEHLTALRDDPRYDAERVFVGGFSQGGIHSLLLALRHPEAYRGVLSISPGGGTLPDSWEPAGKPPLFLVYGEREGRGILDRVERAEALWQDAGCPLRVHAHPGGHEFPADWEEVLGDGAIWLLENAGPAEEAR